MPETGSRERDEARGFKTNYGGFKHFINPYPWMSQIEAMVHLELERRGVPFSWRFFDGDALNFKTLMPSFAPEFTLREYKIVILIIGNFWGNLPGILDNNALATALLEYDGWKVITLFEDDIRSKGPQVLLDMDPDLRQAAIKGQERANPYGRPDLIAKRRQNLIGQGILRKKFTTPGETDLDHRRNRNRSRSIGDGDRIRRRRRPRKPLSRTPGRVTGRFLGSDGSGR